VLLRCPYPHRQPTSESKTREFIVLGRVGRLQVQLRVKLENLGWSRGILKIGILLPTGHAAWMMQTLDESGSPVSARTAVDNSATSCTHQLAPTDRGSLESDWRLFLLFSTSMYPHEPCKERERNGVAVGVNGATSGPFQQRI
jgi:hypothetical protein